MNNETGEVKVFIDEEMVPPGFSELTEKEQMLLKDYPEYAADIIKEWNDFVLDHHKMGVIDKIRLRQGFFNGWLAGKHHKAKV